ncbi:hypothetical protein F8388_012391 [Cannabis sativa]|uniref:Retrotransposon gag domain-containing protein n=1 Tax=Cannabis sativa TaxID=3483 RepID=A0A7J6G5B5_CANSA|nr:hypothetical protein F8388_012391 [Cannabis sativa]
MKNEEIAALLLDMKNSFKEYSDTQYEKFSKLLNQHCIKTEEKLSKLSLASTKVTFEPGSPGMMERTGTETGGSSGPRANWGSESREVNAIIKTLRVKVARFDGSNVEEWLYKINKFFDLHQVEPMLRLAVIPFHLEGIPSTWFQWMEKSGTFTDWDAFVRAVQLHFGASIYDDPLGRILKLVQVGWVEQYRAEFKELMTRISGVSEHLFLNFFVWGLKMEIQRELLMAKPTDLADAMAKAQLFEDRHDDLFGQTRGGSTHTSWSPRSIVTHRSATQGPPLSLEGDGGDGEDSPVDEVSLNSLSNSANPRIFRLMAKHKAKCLEVLIDTGSNNNFIQESLAGHLGLLCEDTKRFKVYMGNGNSLLCSKICRDVELILQGHQFVVDLYVLPIWGLDVVLGMQWLQTLGSCIHDHRALTMEFNWQGNVVKLAIYEQVDNWVREAAQLVKTTQENEGSQPKANINKGESEMEREKNSMAGREHVQRQRKRPSWLRDFMMTESR